MIARKHIKDTINEEGATDIIYSPFLIKATPDDGFTTYDLSAPILDSAGGADVSAVASLLEKPAVTAVRRTAPPRVTPMDTSQALGALAKATAPQPEDIPAQKLPSLDSPASKRLLKHIRDHFPPR
ncbi:hypothetical protein P3T22_002203 [Paraburkholderia sp. GAS348]